MKIRERKTHFQSLVKGTNRSSSESARTRIKICSNKSKYYNQIDLKPQVFPPLLPKFQNRLCSFSCFVHVNKSPIYGNKSCILQRWFKKISCSEVEVTDSEKDQRGFYIKKVIGDGNCFFSADFQVDVVILTRVLYFLFL
jgi:hypothetical protein